jgi:Protein of unknown function (DUF4038)/Putative collagen-binding domain of a collagenase
MNVLKRWIAALAIASLAGPLLATPAYPLKPSANGRYLVDQNNVPSMIVGDSPQALMVNLSTNEAAYFFTDRAGFGFNTVWVNLLCSTYTGGRADASTYDGIVPFTANVPSTSSYDLTTPNEAYFARVDRMLQLAAAQGIQLLLDPCETGTFVLQTSLMLDNGTNRCRAYGQYLGNRYKNFPNIIWMSGNDFQTWRNAADDAVVRTVAQGIKDTDTNHLHTIELDYLVSSSLDDPTWNSILGLNATYTYYPTYARLLQDYARTNFLPNFLVEANYEFESLQGPVTTPPILRKQEYWTMTSGACGQMYGNGYTWPFVGGWEDHFNTAGATQVWFMKQVFDARAWFKLVPDTNHVLVTSNYGTFEEVAHVADNDYLTAARVTDGSLAIVYTPILRTFTVDMSKLSGPAITRWFDPGSGRFTNIVGSPFANSGTRNFTPPGNNADGDGGWVLILETNSPPDPVPPPPPPPPPSQQPPPPGQLFVQQNFATPQTPQSQVSIAYASAQTAGNANLLAVGWNDMTASLTNVSDAAGNNYHVAVGTFRGNGMSQAIYYASGISGGNNTVTVKFDQPAVYVDLRVTEYSDLASTNAFDAGASATGNSSSASSGPAMLTASNELLFGAGITATSFTAAGPGFANRVITTPDGDIVEDQLVTSPGPYSATAPLNSGAWVMQVAAFKVAGPPVLRIFRTSTNTVGLAWPAAASGFGLQQNSSLAATNWMPVTNTIIPVDTENQVIVSPSATQQYYRLKYP